MKRQPNNNGGFSLLEVILAMALLAIISIPPHPQDEGTRNTPLLLHRISD